MPQKIEIKFELEAYESEHDLPPTALKLLMAAREAAYNAYAPYSRFHVGAALYLADGTLIKGNNQENAAYPSGLCAERTAIFYAGATYPDQIITTIAVVAYRAGSDLFLPVTPCGACRQSMLEYEYRQGSPIEVIFQANDKQIYIIPSVSALLPLKFDGSDLLE